MDLKPKLKGKTFGSLTILHIVSRSPPTWLCRCKCNTELTLTEKTLRHRYVTYCGRPACMPNKGRGGVTHGMSESPTYKHYFHIRGRFGRDTFCDHWQTFENFFADMGQRPSLEHSLARINPNQPFKPGNAVWKKR